MKKILSAMVLAGVALLAGCGGGDDPLDQQVVCYDFVGPMPSGEAAPSHVCVKQTPPGG